MMEIGRLCMKLAGRDAGKVCVVVDVVDNKFVLIDGETRRRKCNVLHLEPLKTVIKIKKNASHEDVVKEFKALDIEISEKKSKKPTQRQKKQKVSKKQGKEVKSEKKPKKPAKEAKPSKETEKVSKK